MINVSSRVVQQSGRKKVPKDGENVKIDASSRRTRLGTKSTWREKRRKSPLGEPDALRAGATGAPVRDEDRSATGQDRLGEASDILHVVGNLHLRAL